MVKLSYIEPDMILEAIDSEGGHALAILLGDKRIPDNKKRICGGKLYISEQKANEFKIIIKENKIKFERDESFLEFAKIMRAKGTSKKAIIKVKPVKSKLIGDNLPIAEIQKNTRFFMKAAVNMDKYKSGKWDGYINLFNKRGNTFPSGLLDRVVSILKKNKIDYEIEYLYDRKVPKQFEWEAINGFELDEDQIEAIDNAIEYGRGIVKAPTGWGKTCAFAKNLISRQGVPTLFIANKKQLLDDARDDFESGLVGAKCIAIKDGQFGHVKMSTIYSDDDLQNALNAPIIVATIQSLSRRLEDEKTAPILKNWLNNVCKLVILDESQAYGTKTFEQVFNEIWAPYRIFLSATPRRTDGATIKLEAASGPCIFNTTAEAQIAKGRLCELDIVYNAFDHAMYNEHDKAIEYSDAYKTCIMENKKRNMECIVKPTLEMLEEGRHVLVLIQYIDHGHIIKKMLIDNGVDADNIRFVWGETPAKIRQSAISEFRKGDFQVMIGSTIFDAGVNIPVISGVVLAGAGNSDITLIQRIGRGARTCEYEDVLGYLPAFLQKDDGKKITKVYDVYDTNVKFFTKQSKNRYNNASEEFGADRVHIHGDIGKRAGKRSENITEEDMDEMINRFNSMLDSNF